MPEQLELYCKNIEIANNSKLRKLAKIAIVVKCIVRLVVILTKQQFIAVISYLICSNKTVHNKTN
jgi:archaellum biogenesis protein FlaJ (TadC family)